MDQNTLRLVRLALATISERLLRILALSMACGLACWAMWGLGWERVVTLAIFLVFAYAVVRPQPEKRHEPVQAERPEE